VVKLRLLFDMLLDSFCESGSVIIRVPVAQLDRASACGAEGRRFESCRVHHINCLIVRWGYLYGVVDRLRFYDLAALADISRRFGH